MSDHLIIRDANTADEAAWLTLWAGYNTFYEASVAPEVTARTWQRILGTDSALTCRVADMDGTMVGFSISLLHEGTWVVEPVCYLEDLFVDPSCRGKGIGRKLIEDLVTSGKSQGWSRLY